ncbi:hypothetical protein, partial [Sphingobium fluviale]|uniref:hypothetical protein n=1 Tax=Sphingobium fluviale TaxID=2506423 RepID=UPI0013E95CF3
ANSKEVLRNGVHFADTVDDAAAQAIVKAMGTRDGIAEWIDRENQKRRHSRYFHRLMRIIADGVRNRFDEVDEPAPEGVRATYHGDQL